MKPSLYDICSAVFICTTLHAESGQPQLHRANRYHERITRAGTPAFLTWAISCTSLEKTVTKSTNHSTFHRERYAGAADGYRGRSCARARRTTPEKTNRRVPDSIMSCTSLRMERKLLYLVDNNDIVFRTSILNDVPNNGGALCRRQKSAALHQVDCRFIPELRTKQSSLTGTPETREKNLEFQRPFSVILANFRGAVDDFAHISTGFCVR